MKSLAASSLLISSLALSACQTPYEAVPEDLAQAVIMDRSGTQIGMARLYSLADDVTVSVTFSGMSPGVHAVHLHTTGDCSASDFTSAGGHLNPGGNEHGTMNPRGAHLGDLPNVTIGPEGSGTVSALLDATSATVMRHIFDADGTAVVIHAGADDYRSDPTGDAGSRIGCGQFAQL